MMFKRGLGAALAAATLLLSAACQGDAGASGNAAATAVKTVPVMVQTSGGARHQFTVEVASTVDAQERGLMYRTNIGPNGGMLFAPYPPEGGPGKAASFWMKNTPTPLDIIFIKDGTIVNIAENTIPYSEDPVASEGTVNAVLELVGGRSAELGIGPGDKVTWPH